MEQLARLGDWDFRRREEAFEENAASPEPRFPRDGEPGNSLCWVQAGPRSHEPRREVGSQAEGTGDLLAASSPVLATPTPGSPGPAAAPGIHLQLLRAHSRAKPFKLDTVSQLQTRVM